MICFYSLIDLWLGVDLSSLQESPQGRRVTSLITYPKWIAAVCCHQDQVIAAACKPPPRPLEGESPREDRHRHTFWHVRGKATSFAVQSYWIALESEEGPCLTSSMKSPQQSLEVLGSTESDPVGFLAALFGLLVKVADWRGGIPGAERQLQSHHLSLLPVL